MCFLDGIKHFERNFLKNNKNLVLPPKKKGVCSKIMHILYCTPLKNVLFLHFYVQIITLFVLLLKNSQFNSKNLEPNGNSSFQGFGKQQ
jgi:hypothetical protein